MKSFSFKNVFNTVCILLIQFFILLVIYTLLRVGFYLYNKDFFPLVTNAELLNML